MKKVIITIQSCISLIINAKFYALGELTWCFENNCYICIALLKE